MIGAICSTLAFLSAWLVARREPKHINVRDALGIGLSYAICATLDRSITDHNPRRLLGMFAGVAIASGWAYQRAWSWRPLEGLGLLVAIAALVAPALATGEPHWWGLATWGPFVASSAFGAWALWRNWRLRHSPSLEWLEFYDREMFGLDRRRRPPDPGIVERTALLLLVSDVCMLLFVAINARDAQQWQGRVSAIAVTVVQVGWLTRRWLGASLWQRYNALRIRGYRRRFAFTIAWRLRAIPIADTQSAASRPAYRAKP